MSEAKVPCDFEFKHDTLKSILEELGKLHNTTTSTRHKVFQQLRDGLNTYCGTAYLDAFYGSRDYGFGSSMFGGSILLLTQASQKVGDIIFQKSPTGGRVQDPHVSHKGHEDCGEKYFNALKACLPKAYAALLFLLFNVSNDCRKFGGGHWNSMQVNESGNSLYHWLIGGSGSDGFIARGFSKDELNDSNTGQKVALQLKNAVSLTPSKTEGSLQNVLCGFLFVCSWDDALTGHACLFLHKFCEKVSQDSGDLFRVAFEEKYSGKKYEELKGECSTLKSQLDSLVNGDSKLSAVCQKNTDLFKDLWDNEKFLTYCEWLKDNLHHIIGALQAMPMESSQWSISKVPHGDTAGPFKYGFVFKASWDASSSKSKLQEHISKLIGQDSGSLGKFKNFLENPSSGSSAGATAGGVTTGVLGAGGLGFGAAYGFNLFGLKDIMSGVFGAIRGLVVGF
ncbi:secreted antigen 1 [Babesia divergens]|uniref:Secreted antigen 1 n=1 Tax=Babesia divergens TaxID=32595 RepID=A0AAD9GIH2_BABDI|nr:secreted antigen 1 [Babesia divergens]